MAFTPLILHGKTSLSSKNELRAQISIETIIIMGIFMLVFASLINLNFERLHYAQEVGSAGEIKMVGNLLASAINNVYSNGEGFKVYLSEEKINFTQLSSSTIHGSKVNLPIVINKSARKIIIYKNTSSMGGDSWSVSIPIVPEKVARENPSSHNPELTISNNGTYVVIYAENNHINVVD